MRRIALPLFLLALLLGPAAGSPPPAATQGGDHLDESIESLTLTGGVRCAGSAP